MRDELALPNPSTNHSTGLISLVIPVYNSQETIGDMVSLLIAQMGKKFRLEIVLVNDASRDGSEAVCSALHHQFPEIVRFFSLAKNVGEHNAVMAGLNQTRGDYAIIMDDDLQNPISEVEKLIAHVIKGQHDVVYTYYARKRHNVWRNLGSRFNDRIATIMLQKPGDLYLSSFKAINRFLIDEIIKYDLPFPYIDGLILRTTDRIGRLEVLHETRKIGKSGYTLRKLIRLWLNMFTNFSILPLRLAMALGFVFSLVGLGAGVYTIIEKFLNPDLPLGWAMLAVLISLFSGVQLIAIGAIGEYLGRIFLALNKKPQYSIRKRLDYYNGSD